MSSIVGVHLVIQSLIAIHRAELHAKRLSAVAKFSKLSCSYHTLGASMVDACSNTCHRQ